MAKDIRAQLLTILRKYELAGDLTLRKEITHIKVFPARQLSSLIAFTYERRRYYVIFDSVAADDMAIVREHILLDAPDTVGEFIRNPLDTSTSAYGVPYLGKDVYLFVKKVVKNRLDQELVKRYPVLSRSTIQKYIKAGYVSVNTVTITVPKYEVTETDSIALLLPEKTNTSTYELPIIYIDDDIIVIHKPTGILTHSKGVLNDEFTVADFFRRYSTYALDTNRPGIVHRLDRDTSGVMVGARTTEAAAMLKKQFADRQVAKHYVAVVRGVPEPLKARIDIPIARNPSKPSTYRVDSKGKPAITDYEVIRTNEHLSLVHLFPKTGRTHQLRVHMNYMNTPILGDRVYGNDSKQATNLKPYRLFLHALSLELTMLTGIKKVFEATLPDEFERAVQ